MSQSKDGEKPDSLDALLRQAAHVSTTVASSGRTLSVGATLAGGRLSILRKLGEGGMGVVYEAFDNQRRGRVALKTLTRVDAAGVYRLKNEFRALSDVTHPNLVQLYELFADGDTWFFTMELIEGERFDRWTRPEEQLDEARLRAVLPQLLAGVDAIHVAGKLHRDLKPSNVLITPEGRVAVLDFGLTVDPELGGVGQTVADESVSGTPAYMAPEQAAGRATTAASDYYAVGVMIFEAVTGRLPFQGRAHEILTDKQRREAPLIRDLCADAPADLAALCMQLLARDATERTNRAALAALLPLAMSVAKPARGAALSVAPAGAPALLGRDRELEALRQAYAATLAGKPVVMFVAGESGMGKSALAEAFANELRERRDAVVLAGRCYERENVPYKGFDALVDELSRYLRKLSALEATALLPREVYALARIFPVLARIQVVAEAPKRDVPDPQDLKRRAFEAFGELLARMRDRAPLVLMLDDLQWIDQDSVRFMRALLVHASPAPLLLVCVHRSEGAETNALLQSVRATACDNAALAVREISVGPLSPETLATIARHMLPDGMDASAPLTIASEARGSPFFAAELARSVARHGRSDAALSLDEALAIHVASLPQPAQRLLHVLALAGQPLAPLLAYEAAGIADGAAQVDRLRSEQRVRVSFDSDGARTLECYHDKIREQATAGLDEADTRALAERLAATLLLQPSSDPELVARMLGLAGRPEAAAEQAARAAERALAALAFTRATALYTQALDQGRFEPVRHHALCVGRAEALACAGQGEQAGNAFAEAAAHARGEEAQQLTIRAGEQYLLCGELERGREALAHVLSQVGIGFPRTLPGTLVSLLWARLRLRLAGLRFRPRNQHDARTLRRLELLRTVTHGLVRSDHLHAPIFGARWVLTAMHAGHTVETARALAWEFFFSSVLGASDARLQGIERLCARLYKETQDKMAARLLAIGMGSHSLMRLGDAGTAVQCFERNVEILSSTPPGPTASYDRLWGHYFLAVGLFASGRVKESFEVAQPLFGAASEGSDRNAGVSILQVLCPAELALDRPTQAANAVAIAATQLRPGKVSFQHWMWLGVQAMPDLYRGDALAAWYGAEEQRQRFFSSFYARIYQPGLLESMSAGVAAAAAAQARDANERRALIAHALRLAKRGQRAKTAYHRGLASAVAACLRKDRSAAVQGMRGAVTSKWGTLWTELARLRLGELMGDREGKGLIDEASVALRAGGVVNPARFAAAILPGVELP